MAKATVAVVAYAVEVAAEVVVKTAAVAPLVHVLDRSGRDLVQILCGRGHDLVHTLDRRGRNHVRVLGRSGHDLRQALAPVWCQPGSSHGRGRVAEALMEAMVMGENEVMA